MIFHVLTIFPEFFEEQFAHGVVKRGKDAGLLDIQIHNLHDSTRAIAIARGRPALRRRGSVVECEPNSSPPWNRFRPECAASLWGLLLSAQGHLFFFCDCQPFD